MRIPCRSAFVLFAALLGFAISAQPASCGYPTVLTQKEPPDGSEAATKQMAGFRLPPGLKAELFAAEPKLMNPVAFCLDEKGRHLRGLRNFGLNRGTGREPRLKFFLDDDLQLKTVEDRLKMYEKHVKNFTGGMDYFPQVHRPGEKRMLEDTTGSGRADRSTVFANSFNDPLDGPRCRHPRLEWQRLFHRDSESLAAGRIPKALARQMSAKSSSPVSVSECAFLGHDLHGLTVGPDGKLYFSIGDRGYNVTNKEGKNFPHGLPCGTAVWPAATSMAANSKSSTKASATRRNLPSTSTATSSPTTTTATRATTPASVYICEGGDSGWNMAFQTIPEPYMAGPWFAERMWHLPHEGQPAWLLPPVGKIGTGPSGFTFSSGVGLPDRYKNTFLMANYAGAGRRHRSAFPREDQGQPASRSTIHHDFLGEPFDAHRCRGEWATRRQGLRLRVRPPEMGRLQ